MSLVRNGGTATYHAIMAWSASLAVHVVLASTGALLATQAPDDLGPLALRQIESRARAPEAHVIELPDLPSLRDAFVDGASSRMDPQPRKLGGEAIARPDTDRAGRGGDATSRAPAINLSPRDDEAHLTPWLQSRIDRAQHSRHRTGGARQSPEDSTAADNPMMLTLFVDGTGSRAEQRPAARFDPAAGSFVGGVHRHRGNSARRVALGVGQRASDPMPLGDASYDALGAGIADGWWSEHSGVGADVMRARPFAHRGLTSAGADDRGDYADTVDAEQEDITGDMSLFHASTAGGPTGAGRGGERGPGPTGSGGPRGSGSRARALGAGDGDGVAVDPLDRRRRMYRRKVWSKIHGAWSTKSFPKQAVLEGKQGYTIVRFTIVASGAVTGVSTVRGSGFADFDAKMRAAVMRAAPFGPLPEGLGPAMTLQHDFIVKNPAVR